MKGDLTGGCLCGAVRYALREGFRLNPYACHCTDCQTRTGSAFSEHMMFAVTDMTVTGNLDVGEYVQPGGAHSRIFGCARCKTRVYSVNDSRQGFASLRCGTLDNSADVEPVAHLWVKSKQPWFGLPKAAKTIDEQPRDTAEWISFVGIGCRAK